jgi:hypothetical protein
MHCMAVAVGDFVFASCFQFNSAGNENSFDSCQEGLRRTGRNQATDRQPSGWAENACIEDRIEPLSPDKLRDTLSPNLRGIT